MRFSKHWNNSNNIKCDICLLHYSFSTWISPTSSHLFLMEKFCNWYYFCLHFTRRHPLREVTEGHTGDKGRKWSDPWPLSSELVLFWGCILGWCWCTDWLTDLCNFTYWTIHQQSVFRPQLQYLPTDWSWAINLILPSLQLWLSHTWKGRN